MERILTQISEKYNVPLNSIKIEEISDSFIDKDMQDYFEENLYLMESDGSYLYFFKNSSERNSSTTILEFFKAVLNVKLKLNTNNIKFYLIQHNKLEDFETLIKTLPVSLDKYSPDFDYILSEFEECGDEALKKSIKLRIFTEVIKYIYKDNDLKDLMLMIINNTQK